MTDLLKIAGMAEVPGVVLATELDLRGAWERVHKKAGMPGADGVTTSRFGRSAETAFSNLEADLANGRYRPLPLRMAQLEKKAGGGLRLLLVPPVVDRVAQTAAAQWLGRKWNPAFDQASYAYRPGMGVRDALHRLGELRDQGFRWILDADLRSFFDSIDHDLLLARLRRCLGERSPMAGWIQSWIRATVWDGAELLCVERGVPQGSPLSPILANFYLHEFDARMRAAKMHLIRYADDFLLLARTPFELEEARTLAKDVLKDLNLELNDEKTRTVTFESCFRFLGAELQKDSILLPFEKRKEPKRPAYIAPVMPPALLRAFRAGDLKASRPLVWNGSAGRMRGPEPAPPAPPQRSKPKAHEVLAGATRTASLSLLKGSGR